MDAIHCVMGEVDIHCPVDGGAFAAGFRRWARPESTACHCKFRVAPSSLSQQQAESMVYLFYKDFMFAELTQVPFKFGIICY